MMEKRFEKSNVWLCFESDKGIVPSIIRYLTDSDINHVALVFESFDWGFPMIFEATTKGVTVKPDIDRNWKYDFKLNSDLVPQVRNEMIPYRLLIGKKYDWLALFLYGWILIFWKWFRVKLRKPILRAKDQLCSELVARVLWNHIKELVPQDDPQWVTPQDLLDVCEKNPVLFEKVC